MYCRDEHHVASVDLYASCVITTTHLVLELLCYSKLVNVGSEVTTLFNIKFMQNFC